MALNFLWTKLIGGRLNYHLQLFGSSLQAIIFNLFLEKKTAVLFPSTALFKSQLSNATEGDVLSAA